MKVNYKIFLTIIFLGSIMYSLKSQTVANTFDKIVFSKKLNFESSLLSTAGAYASKFDSTIQDENAKAILDTIVNEYSKIETIQIEIIQDTIWKYYRNNIELDHLVFSLNSTVTKGYSRFDKFYPYDNGYLPENDSELEILYTIDTLHDDRKMIAGYDCYKVEISKTSDYYYGPNKIECYVTDDINLPYQIIMEEGSDLPISFPLEIKVIKDQTFTILYKLVELTTNKFTDSSHLFEDDEELKNVCQSFQKYRTALFTDDIPGAQDLIDEESKSYYTEILDHVLYSDSIQLERTTLMDKRLVLFLRHHLTLDTIVELSTESILEFALKKRLTHNGPFKFYELGNITYNDDNATGIMVSSSGRVDVGKFHFNKEDGVWKVNLRSYAQRSESSLKSLIVNSRITETDYIKDEIKRKTKREMTSDIWIPFSER